MQIRIVGAGDHQSRRLERLTREVAEELHVDAKVEVTDLAATPAAAGIAVPALMVDGSLKAAGRVPTRNEIGSWLYPRLPA